MEPTFTWLDLTASDRDKMRRVLDLFSEQGTVDELGLGGLRDALAEALFPGTSTIQTRLRYALFIPWIYQRLEARRVPSREVARDASDAELDLIEPLKQSADTEGLIGARAGRRLTRLPSSVYWAGLVRWNVFQHSQSQSWYHTHFASLVTDREEVGRADDPGVVWARRPTWHPRMPRAPKAFPDEISFALTRAEAEFLQGRIEERCAGTLLAWLVREGSDSPAERFWDDPNVLQAPQSNLDIVELARRFSLHVEGAPLLYNLMLAETRQAKNNHEESSAETYRSELAEWAEKESAEAPFDPSTIWLFAARHGARVPEGQRRFVEDWCARVTSVSAHEIANDRAVRAHIAHREAQLKGGRARLTNDARLLDWRGPVGVGRMDFRWFRVRQLLIDLHRGLAA